MMTVTMTVMFLMMMNLFLRFDNYGMIRKTIIWTAEQIYQGDDLTDADFVNRGIINYGRCGNVDSNSEVLLKTICCHKLDSQDFGTQRCFQVSG